MHEPTVDNYTGCLVGLAVGDALGVPLEFLSWRDTQARYGAHGISDLHSWGRWRNKERNEWEEFAPGTYTDDTQLSLATAIGCLQAQATNSEQEEADPSVPVYRCYLDWLDSLTEPGQRRGPGR